MGYILYLTINVINVVYRLVWWTPIVDFSKIIEYLVDGGGGALLWKVFSQIHFFSGALHLSLGKAGPVTLESNIHVKALKMQGFPNN